MPDSRDGAAQSAALVAAASAALSRAGDGFGALERSDFAIFVADAGGDQPILFANAAFLDLSGYPLDEVIGRNCRFLQGPGTQAQDVGRFRAGLASGRPFHLALVNHRRDGAAFRNEIFVSPIRDAEGAIARYVAILAPSAAEAGAADAEVAALRHQVRNQFQTMTSLVGLFGQRLGDCDGRDAFQDLRARIEALSVTQSDDFASGRPVALEGALARLADRLVQLYDPMRRHKIAVRATPAQASSRRAATLAQILAELVIDLFRNGLGDAEPGAATIEIIGDAQGAVTLAVARPGAPPAEPTPLGELGLAILENLTRGLDGEHRRSVEGGLFSEAAIPAEAPRR